LLDYRLVVDSDDDVWLFISDRNQGAFYFNSRDKSLIRINQNSSGVKLNSDIVKGIVQDNKGLIWIATDHGGINLIDKKDFSVDYIRNDPDDSRSLCDNSVNVLYKDYEGLIWIGTFKKEFPITMKTLYVFACTGTTILIHRVCHLMM
jgi:ligand-binding sensor domain-containing protein